MKSALLSLGTTAPTAALLIRLSLGLIFFTQGILKFLDPNWGVLRFTKIGFPYPDFTAHFVGSFEVICGLLVTLGLLTQLAGVPLLITNLIAISTTKIPELFRPDQGFWFLASDARTDFAMFMGTAFLLIVGAGPWSLDVAVSSRLEENGTRHGAHQDHGEEAVHKTNGSP